MVCSHRLRHEYHCRTNECSKNEDDNNLAHLDDLSVKKEKEKKDGYIEQRRAVAMERRSDDRQR
jgi:hypothetical protein